MYFSQKHLFVEGMAGNVLEKINIRRECEIRLKTGIIFLAYIYLKFDFMFCLPRRWSRGSVFTSNAEGGVLNRSRVEPNTLQLVLLLLR